MELKDFTLGGLLEYYRETTPDHDFMVYPDRGLRFTYKEFDERVNKFAKGLIAIGVTRGSHVGIWAKNVPDWLTFMFATAKIGAVLVTINTNYRIAELEYLMKNSDLHTLCMVEGYRGNNYLDTIYELIPELKTDRRSELSSERLPRLKNVVFIGQEKFRGMYNTSELYKMGSVMDDTELNRLKALTNTHDVVNIQYTSGTTGFPKGVMLSHHNILNNGNTVGECMQYTAADKVLTCVPLFHCFGCVLALCAVITHGATMVMVEEFDAHKVLSAIEAERATSLYGVPTMFIAELNHPSFSSFDLTSLRTGIMAGAPCPIETMNQVMTRMHCKDIIIVYGLTETSPGMTCTRTTDAPEIRSTTVGKAMPFVDVKVIDPETGKECPPGVQGEMCCKGYNLMKGYYNNPEASAAILDKDGYLHSGDVGVMDKDGYFSITGRIKDMIIRGGENIYPREIENFLYNMPQIQSIEVVGIPSPRYGEQIGAFIITKAGMNLTEDEVINFCTGKISRYKIPKYIFFVTEYPMTASGKVQKYKMKDWGLDLLREKGVEVV